MQTVNLLSKRWLRVSAFPGGLPLILCPFLTNISNGEHALEFNSRQLIVYDSICDVNEHKPKKKSQRVEFNFYLIFKRVN